LLVAYSRQFALGLFAEFRGGRCARPL